MQLQYICRCTVCQCQTDMLALFSRLADSKPLSSENETSVMTHPSTRSSSHTVEQQDDNGAAILFSKAFHLSILSFTPIHSCGERESMPVCSGNRETLWIGHQSSNMTETQTTQSLSVIVSLLPALHVLAARKESAA